MYKNKTFLAIIAARGGSKRLPKKNILNLAGKPLITWTVEASLKSQYVDEVMVTTDNREIYNIAQEYGASVPFLRPNSLSTDIAARNEVIEHAVSFYKKELKQNYDYIVYLQPTSPLRTTDDIDNAIKYMFNKNADAIVSVCEVEHPIQWSGDLPKDKNMSSFLEEVSIKLRSQDLVTNYRINGAIYICDTKKFLREGCMFLKENIYAYEMNQSNSVDIDTKQDFNYANYLISQKLNN